MDWGLTEEKRSKIPKASSQSAVLPGTGPEFMRRLKSWIRSVKFGNDIAKFDN
jgi:hypothetical protein